MFSKANRRKGPHCAEVKTQAGTPTAKVILLKPIETFRISSVYCRLSVFGAVQGWGGVVGGMALVAKSAVSEIKQFFYILCFLSRMSCLFK